MFKEYLQNEREYSFLQMKNILYKQSLDYNDINNKNIIFV
jgi:hypothetical protein